MTRTLRSLALLLALAGCSSGAAPVASSGAPPSSDPPSEAPVPPTPTPVVSAAADPAAPLSDAQAQSVRASLDGLTADLTPHLLAAGENAAFSPASIELAFAMTAAGAAGPTRDELAHALHLDGGTTGADPTAAIDAVAQAGRVWGGEHTGYELAIANRLFGEQTFVFEQPYLDRVAHGFGAPLEPVDFVGSADAVRTHVNDWVLGQTHDRIRDLLPAGSVDASTALVLVNAVYFHATWATAFDPDRTRPEEFTTAQGEHLQVPTMSRALGPVRYAERDGATIVELGYTGGEVVMTLVLPPAGTPAASWITPAHLASLDELTEQPAELHLPRFRVESTESVSLRASMEALGVHLAWNDLGDCTSMAARRGQDPIHLDDAFHRVFVMVNEEGTEAAAATAVTTARGAAMAPTHTILRFDRPFLFFLRDARTHGVMFAGRVGHPQP